MIEERPMKRLVKCAILGSIGLALAAMGATNALAQEGQARSTGWHLSALGFQNSFAGHFDGDHYFENGGVFYLVPKLDSSFGWGGGFGFRAKSTDTDFFYAKTTHDYTYPGFEDGKAHYSLVGFDTKVFIVPKGIIQPFVSIELAFTWLKVEHGSVQDAAPFASADNTFSGLTLGAGGGLEIYPIPAVGIFGAAIFSWETFGNTKGYGGERLKLDKLDSLNFNLRVGMTVRLFRSGSR
jgi:hypothetical protein